jgi:phosphomannomutase/phosphoglucomutase
MADKVRETGADVGLGFDGDGDRCGVVDNQGEEIFADKIGVMLARDLSQLHPGATFVVDVKSTGLFLTDPELKRNGVKTDYWKTGHSYIKRRVNELGALAGFEKSGHFFFNKPVGRGYDDGLLTAIAVVEMLDRNLHRSMADLYRTAEDLGLANHVSEVRRRGEVRGRRARREAVRGDESRKRARWRAADPRPDHRQWSAGRHGRRTWGLVRASSNKPELVVVVESPVAEARMREMFKAVDGVLRENPDVGDYNQSI